MSEGYLYWIIMLEYLKVTAMLKTIGKSIQQQLVEHSSKCTARCMLRMIIVMNVLAMHVA